jgi:hypothetical protein
MRRKAYLQSEFLMPKKLISRPVNLYAQILANGKMKEVLRVD